MRMSEPGMRVRVSFWYGLISLFTSILHNIYLLYHVEMFLYVYKIDKKSFWIGETVFMVWNSMNDPLFGWISDRVRLRTGRSKEGKLGEESGAAAVLKERLRVISIVGPLFAVSFLSFWIPWGPTALQFVCCLCVYDGCLTAIDLHHSALLADLAVTTAHRAQMSSYQSLFSAVGSVSVFLSYTVWDRSSTDSFLLFAALLTAFSTVGYLVSTRALAASCRIAKLHSIDSHDNQDAATVHPDGLSDARVFLKQLLTHRNFFLFTAVNLVQVFHCHFNSNFFPAFLKVLLGDSLSTKQASLLLGVSFVAPHINNMLFLQLCKRWGLHSVIRLLLYVKISLAAAMWLAGPQQVWLLCLFVASNRIFTEGTCKLLHLAVSDLVDEDCARHGRRQPVAALVYGMANFLAKPGQTVAPLVGTLLLSTMTGHDVFQTPAFIDQPSKHQDHVGLSSFEGSEAYKQACYSLIVFLPMACGTLQMAAWAHYSLFGQRLAQVKSYRARFCLTAAEV